MTGDASTVGLGTNTCKDTVTLFPRGGNCAVAAKNVVGG